MAALNRKRPVELAKSLAAMPKRLQNLQYRVGRLEEEVQELRRLHRRVAEIADVVQEVLLPAADRDDERIRRVLNEYRDAL